MSKTRARATKARFAKYEGPERAGYLARAIQEVGRAVAEGAISEEDSRKEIELHLFEAERNGVLDLVQQIVNGVPRLPPEREPADLHYNVLDRLHKRVGAMLVQLGRERAKETDEAHKEQLALIEKQMAEESSALAAVLDPILKKAHAERAAEADAAEQAAKALECAETIATEGC